MAIVQKWGHRIGDKIDSPVYVDANFLVNYLIRSETSYSYGRVARNVMGDLLAQGVTILISLVTVEEAWWATIQELYRRHIWQPRYPGEKFRFDRNIAKQHLQQIMQHKHELRKIVDGLQELRDNGADIRFVPECERSFEICQDIPDYMDKHNLFSADALHLSLALSEAMTLITFDVNDFQNVLDPSKTLTIMLLS